ncbi:MAG: elongation factor P [Dehalococcoidales bacterium]|nr:elongation factor P [Dehalococcoidales bacterium]
MSVNVEEVTRNTKILYDSIPFSVEGVEFVKPGKGRAIYKFKLRNLLSGNILDITLHSGDKVEETSVTMHEMQYLFTENDNYIFMDSSSFEQMPMTGDQVGDKGGFLKEGMEVVVMMWENRPIDLQLPKVVELKVIETSASLKGATITAQNKEGKLETGMVIGVPAFIKEGDVIKVDTRSGSYIERVGGK